MNGDIRNAARQAVKAIASRTGLIGAGKPRLRSYLGRYPALYYYLYADHPMVARFSVRKQSDVVVEGFPRSANSFAVTALSEAQQHRPSHIAHHLHVPAQIVRGVQWGIPTLVLVRHPIDAVASLCVYDPRRSVDEGLREYILFYSRVIKLPKGSFTIGPFEEVTSDYSVTIERLNQESGSRFDVFHQTKENTRNIFRLLETMDMKNGKIEEYKVSRPSTERSQALEHAKKQMTASGRNALVDRAVKLYAALMDR